MNIHHIFFATGSFLGPLVSRFFLRSGFGWQLSYRLLGLVTSLIGLFFFVAETGRRFEYVKPKIKDALGVIKQKNYLVLLIINFFGMGTQFVLMYLIVLFLKEARGFDVAFASLFLSMFYVMLGAGRLICGFLVLKTSNSKMIMILFILLLVFTTLAIFSSGLASGIFFILTGLASSGIFPGMLALTSIITGERVMGSSLGLLTFFGGIGGMVLTYVITNVSELIGLIRGFSMVILVLLGVNVLFSIMLRGFVIEENKINLKSFVSEIGLAK